MVRNLFKAGAFKMIMAVVGLSAMAGLSRPAHAWDVAVPSQFVNTYVFDSSWASAGRIPTLTVNMRGQNMAGDTSGYIMLSGANWSAQGTFMSETDYVDQAGEHVEVKATVCFGPQMAVTNAGCVPAMATFRALKTPTGVTSEGVEIVDQNGTVLYSTGRDANNNMVMLPLLRGALYINH